MYEDTNTSTLALLLEDTRNAISDLKETVTDLEATILSRITAEGGTMLPNDTFKITLEAGSPTYDQDMLRPLLEELPADDLAKAFTDEHEETKTVPARWNGTQLNRLEKYGGTIGKRIADARIQGAARLIVERK